MSRLEKSFKNAKVGVVFYMLNLFVQFFSRKYFIEYLGTELLGLNSVAVSLISFLAIAELGISTAVSFSLYKPIFNKEHNNISEIIGVQSFLYKNVALIILIASGILMFFFPYLFRKTDLPLIYAYATFGVLLFGIILQYTVNYKQIIFQADQKNYILIYIAQGGKALKAVAQLLCIIFFDPHISYWLWLLMELIFSALISLFIEITTKKHYPFITAYSYKKAAPLRHKHKYILKTTKQAFFHKIGGFALSNISPLLIYLYVSLNLVAVYDNYILIFTGIILMFTNIFNGLSAGVGNLVAEKNIENIKKIYWELFALKTLISGIIIISTYFLCNHFVEIWIGKEFMLSNTSLILLVSIFFIRLFRDSTDIFISAFGLFKDILSPITEAVLNLGLSLLFGYYWGLDGILLGVFLSLFFVIFLWKPIFLFREKMHESVWVYLKKMIFHLLLLLPVFLITYLLIGFIPIDASKSLINWIIYAICVCGISSILGFIIYYLSIKSMRNCIFRILGFIKGSSNKIV